MLERVNNLKNTVKWNAIIDCIVVEAEAFPFIRSSLLIFESCENVEFLNSIFYGFQTPNQDFPNVTFLPTRNVWGEREKIDIFTSVECA